MNFVGVHIPFDHKDIKAIEDKIKERDIIRTVYSDEEFNQYTLGSYLEEVHVHGSKFVALFDRNIFSDIIAVARNRGTKGGRIPDTQRTACALLAFLQISKTLIEPGMAIYEYIDSGHFELAKDELSIFRAADNAHPQIFIDIALGRLDTLPAHALTPLKIKNIEKLEAENIYRWKLHYGLTLKIALIEKAGGRSIEKIKTYLEWMYEDYIFSAPAIVFGVIYFSGKRISKMIKNLNSGNVTNMVKGLRNTAWDMTIAHYWSKRAIERKKHGEFWILCTADKALKEMASFLASSYKSKQDIEAKTNSLFVTYLGHTGGNKIYDYYLSLVNSCNNPDRKINKLESTKALYPFVDDLEQRFIREA